MSDPTTNGKHAGQRLATRIVVDKETATITFDDVPFPYFILAAPLVEGVGGDEIAVLTLSIPAREIVVKERL